MSNNTWGNYTFSNLERILGKFKCDLITPATQAK